MADEKQNSASAATDKDVEDIINSGTAGVETAMRVFEKGEQVYYGAVAATTQQETVTVSASTSPKNQGSEIR